MKRDAASVVVGGHEKDAFPSARVDEARSFDCFFLGVFGAVRELHDRSGRDAEGFQIVLHHFGDADVLAQHAAARDDNRRDAFAVQFGRMKGTVGRIIVVAKNDHRIGMRDRLVHHPKLRGKPHQRMPDRVKNSEKSEKEQKEQQPEENAALFAALSSDRVQFAQPVGRFLGQDGVVIDFLDAVGLAARFDDGQDFDVPVVVVGDGFPVRGGGFALGVEDIG